MSEASEEFTTDVPGEVFWDPRWFHKYLTIRTKSHGLQPFILNDQQMLMTAAYIHALANQKWLVHVKPRREGSSTFFAACVFQHVMFRQGIRAAIIAHKKETAKSLAKMVMMAFSKFPSAYKPAHDSRTKSRLVLLDPHFSELAVSSVQDDEPERGETTQVMLATEISSWAQTKSEDAWVSARSAVPPDGGLLIAESTPKYEGDPLQLVWQEGDDGQPTPWHHLFIPWTAVPEYRSTPPHWWEPTGDVLYYAKQHPHVPRDGLYWMATVGLPSCANNLGKFMSEYPISDVECWAVAGETIFDKVKLTEMTNSLGLVENLIIGCPPGYPMERGGAVVYRPAIIGHRHLIIIDPASSFGTRDLFGVVIIDIDDWEVVLDYLGWTTAPELANLVAGTANVTGWAEAYPIVRHPVGSVVVDRIGVGETVILALIERGIRANSGLYYGAVNKTDWKPGWTASGMSKTQAIGHLQEYVADGSFDIKSRRILKQLRAYRNNWMRDGGGGHFDLVVCMAIASWWLKKHAAAATSRPALAAPTGYDLLRRALRAPYGSSDGGIDTAWGRHL